MSTTYAHSQTTAQKVADSKAASLFDSSSQSESLQRKADMANNATQRAEAPRPNNTGMPDNLKSGIESLSGFSMDDVRVHYNSSKPATVQALAYTQGTDIHVAPGQEKHLPHEAWHVAQQMAGRVSPTTNINGMPVNDHAALEHEADVMGEKAVQCKRKEIDSSAGQSKFSTVSTEVMQCTQEIHSGFRNTYYDVSYITPKKQQAKVKAKLKKIIKVMFNGSFGNTSDKIVIVVIPCEKTMTSLPEFSNMDGQNTNGVGGYRSWKYVRGCGGNENSGTIYVGVTEENLIGGTTTINDPSTPKAPNHYEKGYSTTTHEIAHSIHQHRMNDAEKTKISDLYNEKINHLFSEDIWPDGPCYSSNWSNSIKSNYPGCTTVKDLKNHQNHEELEKGMCYASQTELEYFAQSVNTFLGTNTGKDPYTGSTRHNEKKWLADHDKDMYNLLKRRFGKRAKIKKANPYSNP